MSPSMVSVGLAMLSLGLASQQNYREQPLPRIFSSKALNGDVSEQLGTPAQRAQPLAPHHIAGEMENVPANSQAFLSPTGRERYTNGVGTAPRNTKCAFPFIAGGQLFTDCTTENLGQENSFNSDGTEIRSPVGFGTGAQIGHGWCSTDTEYAGRWGGCMVNGYKPDKLTGKDAPEAPHEDAYRSVRQGASFYANPGTQYHFHHMCILAVLPRCSERVGGEVVTITGKGFVAANLGATFRVGAQNKSATVTFVSSKELHVMVPRFLEITETTVGSLDVMSHGRALHFCNDVATADTYRYLPAFSIQGIRELLFVSDLKNHKIHQLDSTEGVYKDLVETGSGGLKRPYGLEVGPDGALYVASSGTKQILRYELPSGQFRGVWASVPGEPRGIRWHLDYLYVVSYYQKRVLRYKHHNSTWNPRAHEYGRHASYHHVFTQDMDQIVSRSAADIRSGGSTSERLSHPNDLQFHAIDGELKLFVTSAQQGIVFQFHGVTGTYERIFTNTKVNLASTLAFSHRPQNSNLFVSSPYSATAFVQFDGTTGKMKQQFMDPNLRRAKGMVILGDTMYVTNGYTLRKYDIDSGTILEDAITIPTSSLAGVTLNMKCGADYGHSTLDPDRDNKTPHGPLSHHYEIFSENYQ